MKQMMAECNIDEGLADSGTTLTDKEIEERLARLKDMDPSNGKSCAVNPFTPELKKCILPTFQKAIV